MGSKLKDECQIKEGGHWTTFGISDALKRRGDKMRCPSCHGPVRPHKEYSDGARAHFEHLRAHTGCPTKTRTFSGVPSLHPDALK